MIVKKVFKIELILGLIITILAALILTIVININDITILYIVYIITLFIIFIGGIIILDSCIVYYKGHHLWNE